MTDIPDRLATALSDRYRLEHELGQGGMATVYLAEDLKHDRKVAIKVLKPELAAVLGAERFVTEIKTTAALQHPNILPLFDSGSVQDRESGSTQFLYYVMPYVDGETLRTKLNRETQLSIEESVTLVKEVADALQYAHEHGVVHRDIKPENILLHAGRPMVADFGIALAVSAAAGGRMTETGLSLGTPHYMSPEQATAEKHITNRSDVYSLAAVLYEMLTGNPPHMGSSAQQIIMRIVSEAPVPVTSLRKSVPPNVAAALGKALEKLPADRFESATEFAAALQNPGYTTSTTAITGAAAAARPRPMALRLAIGAGILGVGLVIGFFLHRPATPAPEVVRFTLPTRGAVELASSGIVRPFTLSPDGRSFVFAGHDSSSRNDRLYRRSLDQLDASPIQGTDGAAYPFFSPDGRWIGFSTTDGRLRKVPTDGGPPVTLVDSGVANGFTAPFWGDNHTIVYTTSATRGLATVDDNGGPVHVVPDTALTSTTALDPSFLPDGAVLFEKCSGRCSSHDLAIYDPNTGSVTTVIRGAGRGWYLPSGYLLYATDDRTVNAVPFDAKTHQVTGSAVPLLQNVAGAPSFAAFAVSTAGTMVYSAAHGGGEESLALVDRSGRQRILTTGPMRYGNPRLSPDGTRIVVSVIQAAASPQIWIYDIRSATLAQLTFDGDNIRPSWSPDGKRVVFGTDRTGTWDVWWAPADGSSKGERVAEGGDVDGGMATSWSRDGKWIVFDGVPDTVSDSARADVTEDVFALPTTGTRTMRLAVGTDATDEEGEVSPNGQWIAYTATRSGVSHVYVTPFLHAGGRTLVSAGAGDEPAWISDTTLAYVNVDADSLTVATLAFDPAARVVRREAVLDFSPYVQGSRSARNYDVSRDGKEFLVVRPTGQSGEQLIVTVNWLQQLKQRMETR